MIPTDTIRTDMIRTDELSVDDDGYQFVRVYLDNEYQDRCTYANTKEGYIIRYRSDTDDRSFDPHEDTTEKVFGDVTIFAPKPVINQRHQKRIDHMIESTRQRIIQEYAKMV